MFSPNLQARCSAIRRTLRLNLNRSAHFLSIPDVQIAMIAIRFGRLPLETRRKSDLQAARNISIAQTAQTLTVSQGVGR